MRGLICFSVVFCCLSLPMSVWAVENGRPADHIQSESAAATATPSADHDDGGKSNGAQAPATAVLPPPDLDTADGKFQSASSSLLEARAHLAHGRMQDVGLLSSAAIKVLRSATGEREAMITNEAKALLAIVLALTGKWSDPIFSPSPVSGIGRIEMLRAVGIALAARASGDSERGIVIANWLAVESEIIGDSEMNRVAKALLGVVLDGLPEPIHQDGKSGALPDGRLFEDAFLRSLSAFLSFSGDAQENGHPSCDGLAPFAKGSFSGIFHTLLAYCKARVSIVSGPSALDAAKDGFESAFDSSFISAVSKRGRQTAGEVRRAALSGWIFASAISKPASLGDFGYMTNKDADTFYARMDGLRASRSSRMLWAVESMFVMGVSGIPKPKDAMSILPKVADLI